MAIKDQCLKCKLHTNADICTKSGAQPVYNSSSCQDYSRGISLEKKDDSAHAAPNVSQPQHPVTTPVSPVSSPVGATTPSGGSHQSLFAHPFSFNGRIRRLEYGLSCLIYIVYDIIGSILMEPNEPSLGACLFVLLPYVPVIWLLLAQGAKRCHDLGHSGWYQLIPFYVFWMLFEDGDRLVNEYGISPKA